MNGNNLFCENPDKKYEMLRYTRLAPVFTDHIGGYVWKQIKQPASQTPQANDIGVSCTYYEKICACWKKKEEVKKKYERN